LNKFKATYSNLLLSQSFQDLHRHEIRG